MGAGARLVTGALIGALLLLAGGCARPAGVDGSLSDDWPDFAAAKVPVPVVGACYGTGQRFAYDVGVAALLRPEGCDGAHVAETVHVGTFTGADAARTSPPPDGGAAAQKAYQQCDKAADAYLGGDWHAARVALRYFPPTPLQWQGGARFYRCDLFVVKSPAELLAAQSESFRGGLAGAHPLGYGCGSIEYFDSSRQDIDDIVSTGCTGPHDAEYSGSFVAPAGTYPQQKDLEATGYAGCERVTAAYLGLSVSGFRARRGSLSYLFWGGGKDYWSIGDRTIRCWVISEKQIRKSLKGIGDRSLPY